MDRERRRRTIVVQNRTPCLVPMAVVVRCRIIKQSTRVLFCTEKRASEYGEDLLNLLAVTDKTV
jgi:hypothetical protein